MGTTHLPKLETNPLWLCNNFFPSSVNAGLVNDLISVQLLEITISYSTYRCTDWMLNRFVFLCCCYQFKLCLLPISMDWAGVGVSMGWSGVNNTHQEEMLDSQSGSVMGKIAMGSGGIPLTGDLQEEARQARCTWRFSCLRHGLD